MDTVTESNSCPVETVFPDDRLPCLLNRGHEGPHQYTPAADPAGPQTGAADPLAALLEQIEERSSRACVRQPFTADVIKSAGDVPLLLAALRAVLGLPGEWEGAAASADSAAGWADTTAGVHAGMPSAAALAGRARAYEDCATRLREVIRRELAEEEAGDGR